ncbi:MAG: hydrogenase nickel incorporation protein HypA [Elusimicrobiota bacterium]
MHEWALAEGIITTAVKVAEKKKLSRITRVKIKLGQLQRVEKESLNFAFEELIKKHQPLMEDVQMDYESEEAVFKCGNCGNKWNLKEIKDNLDEDNLESIHFVPETAHVFINCKNCGSSDFEILKGRGVWVDSIKGEFK